MYQSYRHRSQMELDLVHKYHHKLYQSYFSNCVIDDLIDPKISHKFIWRIWDLFSSAGVDPILGG
jgi:hypothetical protein